MATAVLTPQAAEELDELPLTIHLRVIRMLERLKDFPKVSGAKPLRGDWAGHFQCEPEIIDLCSMWPGIGSLSTASVTATVSMRINDMKADLKPRKKKQRVEHVVVTLADRDYVILPREEYDRLNVLAKSGDLPPLPMADADGNYPAVEYARASLARKFVRGRVEAGITQKELARLADMPVETLCRLERGKHTPGIPTIKRIEQALHKATKKA